MTQPRPLALDPTTLPESNATSYPEKFKPLNSRRWNRRLGDHAGLKNFGVNLTRVDQGAQTLAAGMYAGFPAGGGNAHRFVDKTDTDVLLLIVGDRTPFDEIDYADINNHAKAGAHGEYAYTNKDGSPH